MKKFIIGFVLAVAILMVIYAIRPSMGIEIIGLLRDLLDWIEFFITGG